MDTFIISQCLVSVSFAMGIASFQFKKRRHVLLCWFLADFFNAAHFYLLDRFTVTTLLLVSATRFLVAANTRKRGWTYVFMLLTAVGFIFTYQHPISFLILISGLLGSYGTFHPADLAVRIVLMICSILWVTHNYVVGSPVAIVMESAYLVSNIIGLWRFYRYGAVKVTAGRAG